MRMGGGGGRGAYHSADEAMEKAYDRTLMWRLIKYLRPHMGLSSVIAMLVLAGVVFRLCSPWIMGLVADVAIMEELDSSKEDSGRHIPEFFTRVMSSRLDEIDATAQTLEERVMARWSILLALGLGYLASVFLRWGTQYGQAYLLQVLGQKVIYAMRMQIVTHLQKLSLRFYDKNPVGRLVTRVTNDINAISQMFSEALINIIGDIALLVGVAIAMFIIHWKMALLAFTTVPMLFVGAGIFRYFFRRAWRSVRGKLAAINAFLAESFMGMKTIQMFRQEQRKLDEFDGVNDDYLHEVFRAVRYSSLTRPVATVISSIGMALVLWYGGRILLGGESGMTIGNLVAFIWLTQMVFHPVIEVTQKYHLIQAAMASSERVFRLLDAKESIEDVWNPRVPEKISGHIEFRNVWFRYDPKGDWILKGVSFKVEPGESIAIVGETGAGKSSIISLLLRFYDIEKGEILVDGMNIREIDKSCLRRHFGLVLQDVFMFSGSVAYNIRLGEDIPMEEVERCAKHVNAHRFIEKMEGGYEADVHERGSSLSVGERQLIAFARVLAFNPSVLILDEATSNIDMETELLIRDALQKLIKGRTSLIVAHRLSTIQNVDRIVVMHKGEVTEMGTRRELLRKRGLFYRFYQLQTVEQMGPEK